MPDMTEIKRGFDALKGKSSTYTQRWRYYDGDQPLAYTSKRLAELFKSLDTRFSENWCAVVIDAVRDRLALDGLTGPDDSTTQTLASLWEQSQLAIEVDEAQTAALVCGEGFLLAWPDAVTNQPEVYANDPRLVHAVYRTDNPRAMRYAVKGFIGDDERYTLVAYYPDRIETYKSTGKETPDSVNALQLAEEEPNRFGVIPVFHLRLSRRADSTTGQLIGDLNNVIPMQDGINKLLADMMVAAEFGAFKQRWVISQAETMGKLKNAPNEVWDLPAGDGTGQPTSVGEFNPTDLGNYLKAIADMVGHVSAITSTPRHFFQAQAGDPSGEALIAMEAPLVRKVEQRVQRFTPTLRSLGSFLLQLQGQTVAPEDITAAYGAASTIQPRTAAEIAELRVRAGMPLATALRHEGWTDAELEAMAADQQADSERQQTTLGQALIKARRQFDQGTGSDAQ